MVARATGRGDAGGRQGLNGEREGRGKCVGGGGTYGGVIVCIGGEIDVKTLARHQASEMGALPP